jgi:drug/metabolite transporter (DMT)-like permease
MTPTADWRSRWPALKGGVLAVGAAILFGISTPLVQRAGAGVGAFTTAALLYAGAALLGLFTRQPLQKEAGLRRADLPRVVAMALIGAAAAPAALAWGLQHTSGTSASLMLTLEAVFTALLARVFYGESMDARVRGAMLLLIAGGALLVADIGQAGSGSVWGLLAVLLATAGWGADNALSRGVAERDPAQVVLAKSALGAAAALCVALFGSEPLPGAWQALALMAIGVTGYGLSLRLYLLAQRAFGAGRAASVFAFAPFIGASVAAVLGERELGAWTVAAALLMVLGVLLHLSERHEHEHAHESTVHEHAHSHDDGHHDHIHEPMPAGMHSHSHEHGPARHTHPHVPDAHHTHRH